MILEIAVHLLTKYHQTIFVTAMRITCFTICLIVTVCVAKAQTPSYTISGTITDAASGEVLIGATVYDYLSGKGTTANSYGFYSLTLPSDSVKLRYAYVGYEAQSQSFYFNANRSQDIEMGGLTELQGVEIRGTQKNDLIERSQMSTNDIPLDKVRDLPVLLGERDIMKTIQLLPGVQSGSEGSAGLYVRGGGPDQNLILIDGVPIYNANHLFGFFSVFNTDAINSVNLIKGGFPAEYGGRLSSVIDIRMKEGNSKKIHGEGGIGLIASRLTLEGPIIKDKTSFIISGRRTYIDVLTRPLIRAQGDVDGGYYFYDLNAKVNHKFSDRSRLYLSGYFGKDRFYAKDKYEYGSGETRQEDSYEARLQWGNEIGALRWNYIFNPRLFSNTTVTYSNYQFDIFSESNYSYVENGNTVKNSSKIEYLSGIRDLSAKMDFNFLPNPDHYIKFGGAYTYHRFNPGVNRYRENSVDAVQDTSYGSSKIYADEFYIYAQDDFKITDRLKVNGGLHFSGFIVEGTDYYSLQPRVSGRYLLTERTALKASFASMAQFLHLLTNAGIGLPTDLWVPPTANIKPQTAQQLAAGAARQLNDGYEVSIEGYYKWMNNLIEYKDGASFLANANDWQTKVETGRGWSYGGEVLFEKKAGKTTGWIGYTLSWSDRQFEELNNGEKFPYRYDRRHDVSVALTHKFNERVDVGVVWVYGTGNAVTLPTERYRPATGFNSFGNDVGFIESRNNYRMPAYHRLDVGVNFRKDTRYGTRVWSFGLYNAYSRQNPFFLYFSNDRFGNTRLTQVSLFPIIPSFSYNFKF